MTRFYGKGNRIMVLGTSGIDSNGEPFLTKLGEDRANRAAEEWYNMSFDRKTGLILVAGGYPKELRDCPPKEREARLLGRYLIDVFNIPKDSIIEEDESTSTEENFTTSLVKFPDFFKDIASGERRLGLVSHSDHLKRAVKIGSGVIGCYGDNCFRELPTR